ELTKLHESIHGGTLAELVSWASSDSHAAKGEVVLLVAGTLASDNAADADTILAILLKELPVKQAVALTAKLTGRKRNAVYQRALEISAQQKS
ncbi:MAG: 16S rRNA (cytidine(1402)-2'-O)-methyltransferase, partial [Gammaproteobacteria bacterium]